MLKATLYQVNTYYILRWCFFSNLNFGITHMNAALTVDS